MPVLPETLEDRLRVLQPLSKVEAPYAPGGFLYQYTHLSHQEREITAGKSTSMKGSQKVKDGDEWDSSLALMATDAGKALELSSDSRSMPATEYSGSAHSRGGKRAKKTPEALVEEMEDGDEDKEIAGMVVKKNSWVKTVANTVSKIDKEINSPSSLLTRIHQGKALLGTKQVCSYKSASSKLKAMKVDALKWTNLYKDAAPSVFVEKPMMDKKEKVVSALAENMKATPRCLSEITPHSLLRDVRLFTYIYIYITILTMLLQ